jgi:hypothetical protein
VVRLRLAVSQPPNSQQGILVGVLTENVIRLNFCNYFAGVQGLGHKSASHCSKKKGDCHLFPGVLPQGNRFYASVG